MNRSPLAEAAAWAAELHRDQTRKGSGAPYVTHVFAVAARVADHGGTETEILAALLHDAVEDVGGDVTGDIERRFGPEVLEIVLGCSDADGPDKGPWRPRKEAFIARLAGATFSVRRVVAADKIHNAESLVRSLRIYGDPLWQHFRGGRDGTLWYYDAVRRALATGWGDPILEELELAVARLERAAGR